MDTGSNSKSRSSFLFLPCEYCHSKAAVLFCRADSAKLCLLCDQQVHSANALSLKHIRSQICDNCRAEPASIQCLTDNLALCQNCDWDSHNSKCSVSSLHNRTLIHGFMDCPPVIQLASLFGFDLKPGVFTDSDSGSCLYEQKVVNYQDFLVPSDNSSVFLGSGKCRQEVYDQLVEMRKREMLRVSGDGAELGPGTPPSRCAQQGNLESLELENENKEGLLDQQTPFTSLLLSPNLVDARETDCVAEGDLMWDCNPTYQAAQV